MSRPSFVGPAQSLPASVVGVTTEAATVLSLGGHTDSMHYTGDLVAHILINSVSFDNKKHSKFINRTKECARHIVAKCASHPIVHAVSDALQQCSHHAESVAQHVHEHCNTGRKGVAGILTCVTAEGIYKFYSSQKYVGK